MWTTFFAGSTTCLHGLKKKRSHLQNVEVRMCTWCKAYEFHHRVRGNHTLASVTKAKFIKNKISNHVTSTEMARTSIDRLTPCGLPLVGRVGATTDGQANKIAVVAMGLRARGPHPPFHPKTLPSPGSAIGGYSHAQLGKSGFPVTKVPALRSSFVGSWLLFTRQSSNVGVKMLQEESSRGIHRKKNKSAYLSLAVLDQQSTAKPEKIPSGPQPAPFVPQC